MDPSLNDVAVLVKTFERPAQLFRLLESLQQWFPRLPVLVADDSRQPNGNAVRERFPNVQEYLVLPFDSGLSAGRNHLLERVSTPYFLLLDDDCYVDGRTDLFAMRRVLAETDVQLVGGAVLQEGRGRHWHGNLQVEEHDGQRYLRLLRCDHQGPIVRCDMVLNVFLAETDAVRTVGGWDPELKLGEHIDFFLRAKQVGLRVAHAPGAVFREDRRNDSDLYRHYRSRARDCQRRWLEKAGLRAVFDWDGRVMNARTRVVLGVGTGRCGTLSLASLLDSQPGVRATHERTPHLAWRSDDPGRVISQRLRRLKSAGDRLVVCDVAFYYCHYLAEALEFDPDLRVVCLRRPEHEVVASYRRWIAAGLGPRVNHWGPAEGEWTHDPEWTRSYPQYDTLDMSEGLRRYWREYHARIEELAGRFPGRVRIFEMEQTLNTEAGQRALLRFAGVPPFAQRPAVGLRLHQGQDRPGAAPAVSLIVTCKGRLAHLKQTLPTMLAQRCPFEFEVIVVDYGCPDDAFNWCRSLDSRRLVAVQVLDDTEPFNLSRARNCGAGLAVGKLLAFVDADMRLVEDWLATAAQPALEGNAGLVTVVHNGPGWDRCGTCLVAAEVFHALRGYDEGCQGWGCEDNDFYDRCRRITAEAKYPPSLLFPIKHGDEDRVRHYEVKSIGRSSRNNGRHLRSRGGQVNPEGYGAGAFAVAQGAGPSRGVRWQQPERIRRKLRHPAPN